MLSTSPRDSARPSRRAPRSLRQEYQEFILQRIEEFKDRLPRDRLLAIGDEAAQELATSAQGQYLLTEVLLLEHVDEIIFRRLKLPSFRRWTQKHRALRTAQREPTHWGLEPRTPLAALARRLEPGDVTLVVGAGALPAALFLAAHDVEVFLLDPDLHAIEAAEGRAVSEQLGARFQALVVQFGAWLPDVTIDLAVLDAAALAATKSRDRRALVVDLQARTRACGVHVMLPPAETPAVIRLEPESLESLYHGWEIERAKKSDRGAFVATRSERRLDTAANVSD
jgi:hypothetical protein